MSLTHNQIGCKGKIQELSKKFNLGTEVSMPDEESNIKVDNNLDSQKFLLEQQNLDREKELKLKELENLKKQSIVSQLTVPIVVALTGGIVGLLSNIFISQQNLRLEQKKQEGNLILEVIKTGDINKAAANLIFLNKSGMIHLGEEQRKILEVPAGKNPLPSLPQTGFFPTPIDSNARIYLLAGGSGKIKLFSKLKAELIQSGFKILGEKQITDPDRPAQSEVRYFNVSDRTQSEIIAESIRSNSKEPALTQIKAKQYNDDSGKSGYIEIWVGQDNTNF
jgi:hypothetical protein